MTANRIAYFINQYPAVSHSFIRREIHGLEALGFEVLRIALYGWESEVVDQVDISERHATRYILKEGLVGLLIASLAMLARRPIRFLKSLSLAYAMSKKRGKSLFYHLAYLAEACRVVPILEGFGAEHVHAHFGTNSAEVVMLARELGGPEYSFTVHGPDEFDMPVPLGLDEKVARSAFTIAITNFARAQLYRWVPYVSWSKVKVVRCGLEDEFFSTPPVPIPASNKFVCIGRLAEQKGQLLLIHAIKEIVQEGLSVHLTLVGAGPMQKQIEGLIEELGLTDIVTLTGAVPTEDMKGYIQSAKALVLPSFAEGLPMVIMEAMGLRRPVLTTFVAGIPELVESGVNGWLVPAGSVSALASGMREVIRTSQDELQTMGEAAYLSSKKYHSLSDQAQSLSKLIRGSMPTMEEVESKTGDSPHRVYRVSE